MQEIKNINDDNLQDDDIVKEFCKKCNKQTLFRITILDDGIVGQCSKCREIFSFKIFEKQSSTPTVTCPYCQSTDTKKITVTQRAVKTGLFGIFGAIDDAGKTYKCGNCGCKF